MKAKVKFYQDANGKDLKFAIIVAKYKNKWILGKHKERSTYEFPAGHREDGENIFDTAKRELQEETGAVEFKIEPISVYSVIEKDPISNKIREAFGMLFYAEVYSFNDRLEYEIEKIEFFKNMPKNLTYPEVQPCLYKKIIEIKGKE